MIKSIIFDLDGTLVNAYKAVHASINHALTAMGFEPKSAYLIRRSVGWGDRQLLEGFVGPKLLEEALALYREHHLTALRGGGVTYLTGAKPLLRSLKKEGYKLAIASNRPTRFSHIILEELAATDYFDYVLCADRLTRGKPHPDILFDILRTFQITKNQAIFVGDMNIDIQTGRAAGIKTVAVTTGSCTVEELTALKPYRVIRKLSEFKDILNILNNGKEKTHEQEKTQRPFKLALQKS